MDEPRGAIFMEIVKNALASIRERMGVKAVSTTILPSCYIAMIGEFRQLILAKAFA